MLLPILTLLPKHLRYCVYSLVPCVLLLIVGTVAWRLPQSVSAQAQTKLSQDQKANVVKGFGQMPLYFIENRGQLNQQVKYYVQGSDKTLYFTSQGVTFSLMQKEEPRRQNEAALHSTFSARPSRIARSSEHYTLKLDFIGANRELKLAGEQQTEAVISYFKGKESEQHRGLKTYREVVYRDVWKGIDLVYGGTTNQRVSEKS